MKVFSSQNSVFRILSIVVLGIAMTSCGLFNNNNPEYKLSDLQGLWLENGDETFGHYVRFTADLSDETGYYWGCEWTESDDVHEADLVYHGNGWFKYSFVSAELIEIHKMDQGWADIPKVYTVSALTDSELKYYEKDRTSNKFSFSKVVEAK
jgi:hypothetical protein